VNLRVVSKSPKPIGGMGYKKGVSRRGPKKVSNN